MKFVTDLIGAVGGVLFLTGLATVAIAIVAVGTASDQSVINAARHLAFAGMVMFAFGTAGVITGLGAGGKGV